MATQSVHDASPDLRRTLEQTNTGDLFFMNRKCLAMKDPLGIALCLLTKTENRFDHVGMIVKLPTKDVQKQYPEAAKKIVKCSPSGTYVMETNMKGVTLLAAEDRIGRSSAHEIVLRPLRVCADAGHTQVHTRMLQEMEKMYTVPYQTDVWQILPSFFSPPDKMDRIDAAHKMHQLEHEMRLLDKMVLNRQGSSDAQIAFYTILRDVYANSQRFLATTYFPHLGLGGRVKGAMCDHEEWRDGHFWIDGKNQASRMVCSELICNLWQRTGFLNGFAPASTNRPFDLLDDTRMNFLGERAGFAPLVALKTTAKTQRYWREDDATHGLPTHLHVVADEPDMTKQNGAMPAARHEAHRLDFINTVRTQHGFSPCASIEDAAEIGHRGALLPFRWLVQSTWSSQVEAELPWRLAASGVLFGLCAIPVAPLTLRWVEAQCGLFLVRGTMWSLAGGLLARNLSFAAVQGLFAWSALTLASTSTSRGPTMSTSVLHGTQSNSALVDTRHPYYTVVATMGASAVAAHVITTPIWNSAISFHFGPLRPGPLPMRMLCHGCLSMAPLAMILPFQAYWLSWYETGSSFVIPTRSSVFRSRDDLLRDPRWPHFRNDALVGCFGFMCAADALFYPLWTLSVRRLMKGLYSPQVSPSFGPRLYPGYRYRAVSNAIIFGVSTAVLHVLSLL